MTDNKKPFEDYELSGKIDAIKNYIEDVYENEDDYGDDRGDYYKRTLFEIRKEFDKDMSPDIQRAHIMGMALGRFLSCMDKANRNLFSPIAIYREHRCATKLNQEVEDILSIYPE